MNEDRHFYLYAKHWYKKTSLMADLTKIYSYVYGVQEELTDINDILTVLTYLVQPHLFKYEHRFREMINNIIPQNTWRIGYSHKQTTMYDNTELLPDYDVRIALIHAYMSILQSTNKTEFPFDLGEPDEIILPKKPPLDF